MAAATPTGRGHGILRRRFAAYLVDLMVIFGLTIVFGFLIGVAGAVTFGFGWVLYAVLVPGTAILYGALTAGGPRQSTFGMRIAGIGVHDSETGGPVGLLVAGAHALLFYVAASTFLLLVADVAIGLVRRDRRLGHDLLAGLVVLRRPA